MTMPSARATHEPSRSVSALRVGIAIASALAIAGCVPARNENKPSGTDGVEALPTKDGKDGYVNNNIFIWPDPGTGCKYLVFSGFKKGGITERLRANGTPDCPATQTKESTR